MNDVFLYKSPPTSVIDGHGNFYVSNSLLDAKFEYAF